jgi:tryptophan-rich sensory protein
MRIPIEGATSYRGRNSRPNWLALAGWVGLALGVGALAAAFSPRFSSAAAHWYAMLAKPPWLPPREWFGPIWTVLYASMGIAAWVVWRERYHHGRNAAIAVYATQLLLNALWAPIFFGLNNLGAALFEIIALCLAIGWALREFARVSIVAALILVPYFLWTAFTAAMTLAIWRLNP